MNKVSIYVASHIATEAINNSCYKIIEVGTVFRDKRYGNVQDDVGDNISEKNKIFAEITALYWIWKNDKNSDILGLCHYRRYLKKTKYHALSKFFLDESTILSDLKDFDIILPEKRKTEMTVREHYIMNKEIKKNELSVLREIFEETKPDYIPSFDSFFDSHELCLCNMFVTDRKNFDAYCEWLFPILFELEKRIDVKNYPSKELRICGFIPERLLNIYVLHNHLKVKYYPIELIRTTKSYKIKLFIDQIGILKIIMKMKELFSKSKRYDITIKGLYNSDS